jgi:hypothetical protein
MIPLAGASKLWAAAKDCAREAKREGAMIVRPEALGCFHPVAPRFCEAERCPALAPARARAADAPPQVGEDA